MSTRVLLCTDGSPPAVTAIKRGVELFGHDCFFAIACVTDEPDPMSLTGASGMTGPDMTVEEYEEQIVQSKAGAATALDEAQTVVGSANSETHILSGEPGPALCQLAVDLKVDVIVVGSRGMGVVKRAFIGSVSDHLVRHAPCPVLVVRD